jgi:hypothetical protein
MKVIRQPGPGMKQLEIALKGLEGKVGKVGWFEKSKYEDGTPVAKVAAMNEYGYQPKHIPARPFIRPTIAEKQAEWKKIALDGAKAVLRGNFSIGQVMEALGLKAAADIRKTISTVYSPALAEKTILARMSRNSRTSKIKGRLSEKNIGLLTKPLIDTKIMFNTLTNIVEDG